MKHLKYASYVLRHKWYVFVECCKIGRYWRGIMHDMSKFCPTEWLPYAEYFYGEKPTKSHGFHNPGLNLAFDIAWLKHIHRNPHHWQFWVLQQDDGETIPLEMPIKYVEEMVCDWRGAGKAQGFGDNTKWWYLKNKEKMILHHETRKYIEVLINKIKR